MSGKAENGNQISAVEGRVNVGSFYLPGNSWTSKISQATKLLWYRHQQQCCVGRAGGGVTTSRKPAREMLWGA